MIALLVGLGAAIGAPARYLSDRAVQKAHETVFPWGTLSVNVLASLVLGVLAGAGSHLSASTMAVLGTGFCGSLSTFSTFGYETTQLAADRAWFYSAANVAVSLVAGLGAAAIGWSLGTAFT